MGKSYKIENIKEKTEEIIEEAEHPEATEDLKEAEEFKGQNEEPQMSVSINQISNGLAPEQKSVPINQIPKGPEPESELVQEPVKERKRNKQHILEVTPIQDVQRNNPNFYAECNKMSEGLKTILSQLKSSNKDETKILEGDLSYLQKTLRDMATDNYIYNNGDSETLFETVSTAEDAINEYITKLKPTAKTKQEQQLLVNLGKIKEQIAAGDGVLSQIQRGLDLADNFKSEYEQGLFQNTIQTYMDLPPFGKPVSIDKLLNLDIKKNNPVDVMNTILWLSSYHCIDSRMNELDKQGHPKDQGFLKQQYDRICKDLDNAPYDVQMEYARQFSIMRVALEEKAYAVYKDAKEHAPEGKDPELYASIKLYESPELASYSALQSITAELYQTRIAKPFVDLNNSTEVTIKTDTEELTNIIINFRNGKKRESAFIGEEAINGPKFLDFLDENWVDNPTGKHASAYEIERNEPWLVKSNIDKSGSIAELIGDYKLLLEDKKEASPSFTAMRDSMKALMQANLYSEKGREAYDKLVDKAIECAKSYYDSHNRVHFTENGRQRFRISGKLVEKLENYKKELPEKIADLGALANASVEEAKTQRELNEALEVYKNRLKESAQKTPEEAANALAGLKFLSDVKSKAATLPGDMIKAMIEDQNIQIQAKNDEASALEFINQNPENFKTISAKPKLSTMLITSFSEFKAQKEKSIGEQNKALNPEKEKKEPKLDNPEKKTGNALIK